MLKRLTLAVLVAAFFFALSGATLAPEAHAYTEVEAAIDVTFPADVAPTMKAIAYRESGFNPYAVNPYSGACGPFQFMPFVAYEYGYTCYDLQDPYIAAQAAYALYLDAGLSPWALTAY